MNVALLAFLLFVALPASARGADDGPPIQPFAEPKKGWVWEEDKRFDFLMERLASLEASLDAVNGALTKATGRKAAKQGQARMHEGNNTMMDRKGGGPMRWDVFYGTNAEKFFYHPVDPNTTYHTETFLRQIGKYEDDKSESGIPTRQSLPVHQRPPQWDYIYRANRDSAEKAEEEARRLEGQLEALNSRRAQLEREQADLWARLAFRVIERRNIPRKPVLRFALKGASTSPADVQKAASLQAAARFLSIALLVIDKAEKEQDTALTSARDIVATARDVLEDALLESDSLAEDMTNTDTALGKYLELVQLLDDTANNLGESYDVAIEGDQARDEVRKERFRGLLQRSLVEYSQILLALDELVDVMKKEWKIGVDTKNKLPVVAVSWRNSTAGLDSASAGLPTQPSPAVSGRAAVRPPVRKQPPKATKSAVFQFGDEQQIKQDWDLHGDWRIQNGNIRLLDEANMRSLFRVKGDSAIQVSYEGGNYHRLRVTAWGQTFVATKSFSVTRRGGDVIFSEEGGRPEVVTLKQDELARLPDTSLDMQFESNSLTPSHVIVTVTVIGECDSTFE